MKPPEELTATGIMIRVDYEDRAKLLKSIHEDNPVGKVVKLEITDIDNRFNLGYFVATITDWKQDEPFNTPQDDKPNETD